MGFEQKNFGETQVAIKAVLVDDDKGLRDCLITVLEELTDVRVVGVAQTPAEAVGLMARYEQDWQLFIVDIDLRNGSGLSVLEACRHRAPEQIVIVLTNLATPQVRERCRRLGVDAVFDKAKELDKFFERCKALKLAAC